MGLLCTPETGVAAQPEAHLPWHRQVAEELSRVAPIYLLRPSCVPWRGGAISLSAVVNRLKDLLPPTFEDLKTVKPCSPPLRMLHADLFVLDCIALSIQDL